MPRDDLIQLRAGTAAQWTAVNPVLKFGEPGLETDTNRVKVGDGVTAWAALGYLAADAELGLEMNEVVNAVIAALEPTPSLTVLVENALA